MGPDVPAEPDRGGHPDIDLLRATDARALIPVQSRPQPDQAAREAQSDELLELAAHCHAGHAELVLKLAAFDDPDAFGAQGYRSFAHWITIHLGFDIRTAQDLLEIGRRLRELPLIAQAFGAGRLSLDKVRALISVATAADQEVWLE